MLYKNNKKNIILIALLIVICLFISIFTYNQLTAREFVIRYFLNYNSFRNTFSNEITKEELNQNYKDKEHYIVYFDNQNVAKTEHHYFSEKDYIITYYIGSNIPFREVKYKNINKDLSMLELVLLIEENYGLLTNHLFSIIQYSNGVIKNIEYFENGKLKAYNKRNYNNINNFIYPVSEEHWIRSNNEKAWEKSFAKNSISENQIIYDGNGFELSVLWLYNEKGEFYKSENYENGKLKYYHYYYYYPNSSIIKQIDDYEQNGTFNTRRFYTTFATLMEIRYYDENNINRLIEYYNPQGKIYAIDIKNDRGVLVETYSDIEVIEEFFIKQRQKVRNN